MHHPCLPQVNVSIVNAAGVPYPETNRDHAPVPKRLRPEDITAGCSVAIEPGTYFGIRLDMSKDYEIKHDALRATVYVNNHFVATSYLYPGHETTSVTQTQDKRWRGYGRPLRTRPASLILPDDDINLRYQRAGFGTIEVCVEDVKWSQKPRVALLGGKKRSIFEKEIAANAANGGLDWSPVEILRRPGINKKTNVCADYGTLSIRNSVVPVFNAAPVSSTKWTSIFSFGYNKDLEKKEAADKRLATEMNQAYARGHADGRAEGITLGKESCCGVKREREDSDESEVELKREREGSEESETVVKRESSPW